ncbi:PREDICTED: gamma-interferon-inducible lysosomal thiol reductase-like [Trachymyrmex cornetzi]|uniref:gamma-interferon-inducible lysosomal thiol reductase-like n=1 Tax=Trachymyrmex cornetzi TaxID=471704 RepID=UPI00084EEB28|nr:PREDICTED: gamma-interferon-inducible lysosomal thiol reductase-like [Trachymyrmex cornetzi]
MRFYFLISCTWLAAAVFVTLVSHGILSNAQWVECASNKNVVNVDVYYGPLCSNSLKWFLEQFLILYPRLKCRIHVTFVPYGNATHHRENETGPWQFSCQHGPSECYANKIHACGIHAIQYSEPAKDHQLLTINLISCSMFMGAISPTGYPEYIPKVNLSKETRKLMKNCIASELADDLLAANGDKTKALQSPLRLPTIVINGVYSKENQDEAIRSFRKLICRHLTADKPDICYNRN